MELPDFYNDLSRSFEKIWQLLLDGAQNRHGAAHTPVVATADALGSPQQRVMILRAANREERRLRFHTDARSLKVAEVGEHILASALIYDASEKLQLRMSGAAHVEQTGPVVDKAWQQSTVFARRCYMTKSPPGLAAAAPTSGLPEWIEGKKPVEDDLTEARANFALLWLEIDSIEWLYLANAGHRRAKWEWHEGDHRWSGCWLVP